MGLVSVTRRAFQGSATRGRGFVRGKALLVRSPGTWLRSGKPLAGALASFGEAPPRPVRGGVGFVRGIARTGRWLRSGNLAISPPANGLRPIAGRRPGRTRRISRDGFSRTRAGVRAILGPLGEGRSGPGGGFVRGSRPLPLGCGRRRMPSHGVSCRGTGPDGENRAGPKIGGSPTLERPCLNESRLDQR